LTIFKNEIVLKKGVCFMKKSFLFLFVVALLFIIIIGNSTAQDFKGGVVKYQQTTKHDWNKVLNPDGTDTRPRMQQFIASLPKETKKFRIIHFTKNGALYADAPNENAALPPRLQRAMMGASMRQAPTSEIKKVYYDFEKNEKTEQLEFMTRNFLINEAIENKGWKLTNKKLKVQNYVCQSAELKIGDATITALFCPEIPISAGPDLYYGLPGLILAVEINGETAFMATSVDLSSVQKVKVVKPSDGKKISREEFNKTVEEKVKEFKESGGRKERSDRR
jgi:GLPGLI family protein